VIRNVLFVCIGNICRSPMAEGLFKQAFPEKMVCSAGIHAMIGEPADPLAVQLMWEHGIDISEHRAQNLAGWMVKEADLILTMDREQMRFIERVYAPAKGKIWRVGDCCDYDVPDPYRHGPEAFRHACGLIMHGIDELARRLMAAERIEPPNLRQSAGIGESSLPFAP
jgi:protein-tyrosine phosphatase